MRPRQFGPVHRFSCLKYCTFPHFLHTFWEVLFGRESKTATGLIIRIGPTQFMFPSTSPSRSFRHSTTPSTIFFAASVSVIESALFVHLTRLPLLLVRRRT